MVRGAVREVWLPAASALADDIATLAHRLRHQPMLAHTHGQPATPTTMGKELAVMAARLRRQLDRIGRADYRGKLNGATGTFGAHLAAVPDADWLALSQAFVESLGLEWNPLTTQIESHDWQAELYADVARFNRVLHNVCTDMWTYISMGYFAQQLGAHGSTGSSTMPHKVNPIRFENAEANLEVSCALLDVLASTLVTSRLQRDLTDSSMQRTIGTAFGHSLFVDRQRTPRAGRPRGRPDRHAARPRRLVGGAGRADPVRDESPGRAGDRGHGRAVRAAQGADPWPARRRSGHARVHRRPGPAAPTSRSGCRR